MKLSPFDWHEVDNGKEYEAPKGRLLLRLSQAAPVYVSCEGVEVLAGHGTEIDVTIFEKVTFRVDGAKGTRCFLYHPQRRVYRCDGEIFTNADRKPYESGTVLAVRAEVRKHALAQRQLMREIQAERAALRAERDANRPPAPPEPPQDGEEAAPAPATPETEE